MRNWLEMHVIKTEHHLMNDISCLILRKAWNFCKSFEELATFDDFRDNIVVLIVLNQVNDPYDVGVTLLTKNWQLILQ